MKKLIPFICLALAYMQAEAQVTAEVKKIDFKIPSIIPSMDIFYRLNGTAYFNAYDTSKKAGKCIWKVSDIDYLQKMPSWADSIQFADFNSQGAEYNGKLYVPMMYNNDVQLYEFDGINQPKKLSNIPDAIQMSNEFALNGKIYFACSTSSQGYEPWIHDIATGNTTIMQDIEPGVHGSKPWGFVAYNGKVYFQAVSPSNIAPGIMSYNPANGNVVLEADINPGNGYGVRSQLIVVNGKIYFIGFSNTEGEELYAYDGVNAPVIVTNMNPGTSFSTSMQQGTSAFDVVNNDIYFPGINASQKVRLYKYNTVAATCTEIPVPDSVFVGNFLAYGNGVLFGVNSISKMSVDKYNLYYYDGINNPAPVTVTSATDTVRSIDFSMVRSITSVYASGISNQSVHRQVHKITAQSVVTNVKSKSFDGDVSVYPNPANNYTTISIALKQAQRLNIFINNLEAKTICTTGYTQYHEGKNEYTVNTGAFPAGTYFYSIYDEKGEPLAKGQFIKQ